MNADTEITRGLQAQSILDSDIYKECVAQVKEAIIAQWEASPIRDHEGQHELRLMLKLLNDLQANIKTVADTGKLAKIQIEREKSLLQRVVNW